VREDVLCADASDGSHSTGCSFEDAMTASAGSGITVRIDYCEPLEIAPDDDGVITVGDVTRTGNASTHLRNAGDQEATPPHGWSGRPVAAERRRTFAATSPPPVGGACSPPTIEDIEVESIFDELEEEENVTMKPLLVDDLHLEEPLPLPSTSTEELDRVTTLHSFGGADDYRHRRPRLGRHSPLYRCASTHVDPCSPSRLGAGHAPTQQQRRTTWCSFDAVERCGIQLDRLPPTADHPLLNAAGSSRDVTAKDSSQLDQHRDVEPSTPAERGSDEALANTPSVYLRGQLSAMFQVADNRLAMKLFGSRNALLKEKRRQKAVGNFVIHPCSSFR